MKADVVLDQMQQKKCRSFNGRQLGTTLNLNTCNHVERLEDLGTTLEINELSISTYLRSELKGLGFVISSIQVNTRFSVYTHDYFSPFGNCIFEHGNLTVWISRIMRWISKIIW